MLNTDGAGPVTLDARLIVLPLILPTLTSSAVQYFPDAVAGLWDPTIVESLDSRPDS